MIRFLLSSIVYIYRGSCVMQRHVSHLKVLSRTNSQQQSFRLHSFFSTTQEITNSGIINNEEFPLFSVAPMMDYTDRHQRTLMRLISRKTTLYTEMITTNALVRSGNIERFLDSDLSLEEPIVLQLGGSDPTQMYAATKTASEYGYKEVNINCGCPSEKVAGAGCFGAALMLQPQLVSELALSVYEACGVPATIKCRIGVDDNDSYDNLTQFIEQVSTKGNVKHFIIHARKAVLGANFSPEDNRKIPPLKYEYVHSLVKDFPSLRFTINGGIQNLTEVKAQLSKGVHGVMVGRSIVNYPFHWRTLDSELYNCPDPGLNRRQIMTAYAEYAARQEALHGKKVRRALVKPVFNLFHGENNGKRFRVNIDDNLKYPNLPISDVLLRALRSIPDDVLDRFHKPLVHADSLGNDG